MPFLTYYRKSERLDGDGENFIREVLPGVGDTDITVVGLEPTAFWVMSPTSYSAIGGPPAMLRICNSTARGGWDILNIPNL
jgi:hypothetical protein